MPALSKMNSLRTSKSDAEHSHPVECYDLLPTAPLIHHEEAEHRFLQKWDLEKTRVHGVEEILVGLGILHLVEQEFHRVHVPICIRMRRSTHILESCPSRPAALPCGCRTCPRRSPGRCACRHLAVEDDFRVTGALELFEDHLVHAAAGVDQRGGDDGQRAALLDVARRAEEALGALQRVGVDTAGQHLAGADGTTVL
jgi:hypothetical protein